MSSAKYAPAAYSKKTALRDSFSYLLEQEVYSYSEVLGRCEILMCEEEAYHIINNIYLCEGCLNSLKSFVRDDKDWYLIRYKKY